MSEMQRDSKGRFVKGEVSCNKGKKASEETKKRMSESHKGQTAWNKGKKGVMPIPWNKKYFTNEEIRQGKINDSKKYYTENKEKLKIVNRKYRLKNGKIIKLKQREWRKKNGNKLKIQKKQYYEKNKERITNHGKEYYHKNKEIFKKKSKEYRQKNKKTIAKWEKEYRLKNIEKVKLKQKEYNLKNPVKQHLRNMKQLKKLGLAFKLPAQQYQWALQSWSQTVKKLGNGICQVCFAPAEVSHHLIYKSVEPRISLNVSNGVALCRNCHRETHGWNISNRRIRN